MSDKALIKERLNEINRLASEFCDNYLDAEYKRLCEKLIRKMSRKHNVPFLRGRLDVWAASIIHALGQINFLFDRNTKPYVSASFIADYFNTSMSTTGQKAKRIRDMFKLRYFDGEFSTSYIKEQDPFSDMVSLNRIVVPKKFLSSDTQDILNRFKEGEIIKEYRKYRDLSNRLVVKIINAYIDQSVLHYTGNIFGIVKNNQIITRNFREKHALVDFTLFDYKINGKSFIANYHNKVAENEREIWENLLNAYSSFFKVKDVLRNEHVIILQDFLNESQMDFKLIDINLSQTILPKMLLFTRLVPFNDFKITSGVNFAFRNDLEDILLKEYHSLAEKITYDDPAIKRFISFFKLNRKYGMNVFLKNL